MPIAKDLSIFKEHPFNKRKCRDFEIQRLVDSMKKNGFLEDRAILVNKNMQVMDGNQRLAAAKILGIPVYFTVFQGSEDEEKNIIISIQNSKNWEIQNFIEWGVADGNPGSLEIDELLKKYNLDYRMFCAILGLNPTDVSKKIRDFSYRFNKYEYDTRLQYRLDIIKEFQDLIRESELKLPEFATSLAFKKGVVRMISSIGFDRDEFMKRMAKKISRIQHRHSIYEYVELFTDIYNFRNFKPLRPEILERRRIR